MTHEVIVFTNWLADVVVVVGGLPWAVIGWLAIYALGRVALLVHSD